ncbi:gamma-aminobutyric acid type B receptor subunit 2-like isoform X2 [Symsagittifera roscoffensis]|uniref:gamma-aminobutyric acid type B receptor subunit 2-like isoform X2 n=1 Tax=Symsagittifera roscoffensis TaxID=84072 RepID=UPI00307CA5B3
MILSLTFLVFNIKNRNIRFIKMSSPNLNNIIIVGCLLSYASVFVLGFDNNMAQNVLKLKSYNAVCSIRAWFLTTAFTLSYGSMFSKTWRVHQIFTNVKMKKKVIKDYQLFVVIVFFLFIDILLLISWQLLDPMTIKRTQFATLSISADEEQVLFSDGCYCTHMAKWLALLYGYKGLTMLFGCFLAWETRSVTIPALNDSKYIGINVYVVMLVCLVSIGVTSVIEDADHSFILVSTLILFATTITLCLVFVPKLVQFKKVDMTQRQRFSVASNNKKKPNLTRSAKSPPPNTKLPAKQSPSPRNNTRKNNPTPCGTVVHSTNAGSKYNTTLNVEKLEMGSRKTKHNNHDNNISKTNITAINLSPNIEGDDAHSLMVPSTSSAEHSQTRNMIEGLQVAVKSNADTLNQKRLETEAVREKIEAYFGSDILSSISQPNNARITTIVKVHNNPTGDNSDDVMLGDVRTKANVTTKLSFLNDVEVIWDKSTEHGSQEKF